MKHLILTSALFLTATLGFAQNITEPEYKGQVAVINADSTTTLLQKETGNARKAGMDSATNRRHGCMTNIMGDKPLCNCVKDK